MIVFRTATLRAVARMQVCHRVDGIPVALELAAALVRVLAPEQLAARLGNRFQLLTNGVRNAPSRHADVTVDGVLELPATYGGRAAPLRPPGGVRGQLDPR